MDAPARVLLVNDYRVAGGCEVLVARTLDALRDRGVQAELMTIDDVPGHRRTPRRYINNRPARAALRRRLRELRPDIVHFFNVYHELSPGVVREADRWRRSHPGAGLLLTAMDYHLACPNPGMRRFGRHGATLVAPGTRPGPIALFTTRWDPGRARSLLRAAQHAWHYRLRATHESLDLIVCPSRFTADAVRTTGRPVAVLLDAAPPPPPGVVTPAHGQHLRLVFLGRLEPEKGLAEFLDTALPADPFEIDIVGDGSELNHARAITARHSAASRVRFHGRLPHPRALELLAGADALVLPSRWYEVAPVSIFEALSLRRAVLASALGGMAEIAESCAGVRLFDPFDPGSVRSAVQQASHDHIGGELNAFDASDALRGRTVRAHTDALLNLYARVLAGRRA